MEKHGIPVVKMSFWPDRIEPDKRRLVQAWMSQYQDRYPDKAAEDVMGSDQTIDNIFDAVAYDPALRGTLAIPLPAMQTQGIHESVDRRIRWMDAEVMTGILDDMRRTAAFLNRLVDPRMWDTYDLSLVHDMNNLPHTQEGLALSNRIRSFDERMGVILTTIAANPQAREFF